MGCSSPCAQRQSLNNQVNQQEAEQIKRYPSGQGILLILLLRLLLKWSLNPPPLLPLLLVACPKHKNTSCFLLLALLCFPDHPENRFSRRRGDVTRQFSDTGALLHLEPVWVFNSTRQRKRREKRSQTPLSSRTTAGFQPGAVPAGLVCGGDFLHASESSHCR